MNAQSLCAAVPPTDEARSAAIMAKVTWRLIPFMLLLYICNLLDRSNVSFARLTMQTALGMSDTIFAFGTGLFYFALVEAIALFALVVALLILFVF